MADSTYPGAFADRLAGIADPTVFAEGIFRNSPFGIAIFASDGHCVMANNAFRDLFGSVPPPEYSLFKDDIGERLGIVAILRRAFVGESVSTPPFEYDASKLEHVKVAGRRVQVEVSAFPLPDPDGAIRHAALVYRDVTDQMHSREQLLHAQKLTAVGQLTAGIAHDFNNLLTVIFDGLEVATEAARDDRVRAALYAATSASERAAALTRRMLAFGRRQMLHPEVTDLARTIVGTRDFLRRTLPETIDIEVSTGEGIWLCFADRNELENTLLNLAVNARDAMPNGGLLRITIENLALDADHTHGDSEIKVGDYVVIAITDNGTGMTPEVLEHAIEPFFTTKDASLGTGLGLSSAYGFARQSGGLLRIYSEPGHGTTVRLYLPRATTSPEDRRAPAPPLAPSGRGEVVLVVEDDLEVRKVVISRVERLGYRVLSAPDGPAALAVIDTGERIDVLFTDIFLPKGMNGVEVADAIAERLPGIKVLFTSGYAQPVAVEKLGNAALVLGKPFLGRELDAKLRQAIDGPPYRRPR